MALELESQYTTELSSLHYEIGRFAENVILAPREKEYYEDLISVVDACAADLLGRRARVAAFGSYAMGLSTHNSDLDLVVLNVVRVHSDGFKVVQRARAIKILYKLAKTLVETRTLKIQHMRVVAMARVPVLKVATKDGVTMDIVLNNRSGVRAAGHIRQELLKYPASQPVILVLKSLLKRAKLDDVSTGGLGGYALSNMVLTHCMELQRLGWSDLDYGNVLSGFLEKFGRNFDYVRQAVSSRRGEVVKKAVLEKETLEWIRNTEGWQGRTNGKAKLLIEDPLTGRNLAIGTSKFPKLRAEFDRAAHVLEETGTLKALFNVGQLLRRNQKAQVNYKVMWPAKRALRRERKDMLKARQDIRDAEKRQRCEKQLGKKRRPSQTSHRPSSRMGEMSRRLV